MVDLSPSILSADFCNLQNEIKKVDCKNLKYLHMDVMDGIFVNNISFGFKLIEDVKKATNLILDTHLMIEEPIRYVERFAKAGSDIITIHVEACKDVLKTIQKIKDLNVRVGITLRPSTPLEMIFPYLNEVDLILIMSVEPGFGGQGFIEESHQRIQTISNIVREKDLDILIEVDGGIKTSNVSEVIKDGADLIVSGSDIFSNPNPDKQVLKYYEIFEKLS